MFSQKRLIAVASNLFVFEAAARLQSFRQAAVELAMTQAAVSYNIKQLEEALGVALFLREHRRVTLTEAGRRFHQDVVLGLSHIRRSAEAIQLLRDPTHVTLSISTAHASVWILPRLAAFRARHPEIDLRLQTTDKDINLAAEGIALGVRRGRGDWEEYHCTLIAPERIYPVCSPTLARQLPVPATPQDLLKVRLIHLEEPYRPRLGWRDWYAAQGLSFADHGDGLRLNDYALVIQAALEGQGVALGWDHLVHSLVEKGQLVRLTEHSLQTDYGFYVVWPREQPLSRDAAVVRDWLAGAA
ncbi:MAG TPA: LysR substrate-binding domain-containing protein [Candidatus Competibacteraceae bacterium]|nr:LysR substrate-binding domain-containing protein [Candidatus Competibacteraceae bacterium]